MAKETFAKARERLFSELKTAGWSVITTNRQNGKPLITPYAIHDKVDGRIWFKPQAIYWGYGTSINDARSIITDMRDVTAVALSTTLDYYTRKGMSR